MVSIIYHIILRCTLTDLNAMVSRSTLYFISCYFTTKCSQVSGSISILSLVLLSVTFSKVVNEESFLFVCLFFPLGGWGGGRQLLVETYVSLIGSSLTWYTFRAGLGYIAHTHLVHIYSLAIHLFSWLLDELWLAWPFWLVS